MSYNYQYQQPEQAYQHGSIYGSNASATAGGGYQLGANSGYGTVSYGSSGNASSGGTSGTTQQSSVQNPQYPAGYGGQQAYDPSYAAYYSGSSAAAPGTDAYSRLAAAQAAMAQASATLAPGYSNGQPVYYPNGVPAGSPPSYGGAQSPPSLYSSQTAASNYGYGASYPGGVRSASGSVAGYAPYPTTNSPADVHQSLYGSTYPASHDTVSSTSTALGAVAGMPIPLGSSGGFTAPMNGATGTAADGEEGNCNIM